MEVRKGYDDRSFFSLLLRSPPHGPCRSARVGGTAMNTLAQPDFAVIGGGLCGRLVAWRLAGAGHRVALYERGNAAGSQAAAWVAAAMLAPLAEAASAELLITRLGATSLDTWPKVLAELPEPVFFRRCSNAAYAQTRPRICWMAALSRCRARKSALRSPRSPAASRKAGCYHTKDNSTIARCSAPWPRVSPSAVSRRTGTRQSPITPCRRHA
jgi:choline dehydrogenase-like flavoprotein